MGHPYTQLSMTEREHIELERRKGTSWADLGRLLCRPASAAWREVRRNKRADGFYQSRGANGQALKRRGQPRRVRKLADADVIAVIKKQIKQYHFLVRVVIFVLICAFGYGALTIFLTMIVTQFLIETVVLSMTGGLVGMGIGVLIPWLITKMPLTR